MVNELRYVIFHTFYLRSFVTQLMFFLLLCVGYSYSWYRFCFIPLEQIHKRYELSVKRMESQQHAHVRSEKLQLKSYKTRLHEEWFRTVIAYQLHDATQRFARLNSLLERHHLILLHAQPDSTQLCGDYRLALYKMRIAGHYTHLMNFFEDIRKAGLYVAFDDMQISQVKNHLIGEWYASFLVFQHN